MVDSYLAESDPAGHEILKAISGAAAFNQWMYGEIKPYLHGSILEIGSGTGNISSYCLRDFPRATLSDLRKEYCSLLEKRFAGKLTAGQVRNIDLVSGGFRDDCADMHQKFDSIFALNVIEHIKDDHQAICNLGSLLKPGGTFTMLVPAGRYLYNSIDRNLDHYRRYNRHSVEQLLAANGFEVQRTWSFNSVGILAWWWSGTVRGSAVIRHSQMEIYNRLVPLLRLADFATFKRVGLSVICTAIKK